MEVLIVLVESEKCCEYLGFLRVFSWGWGTIVKGSERVVILLMGEGLVFIFVWYSAGEEEGNME